MSSNDKPEGDGPQPDEPREDVDRARRRLLKAAIYVAPTVISVVAVETAHAQQNPSCNPRITPCTPNCPPRATK
jgi:hypothetical protein